jgi:soluble P-type ATPase
MEYHPKGAGDFELNTIILDLNGTLAVKGEIVKGVKERIAKLKELGFLIVLFSGDQRGTARKQAQELGIEYKQTNTTEEKEEAAQLYSRENTVAIGNARIDIGTFKNAKIRIATLQSEGIHAGIIPYVDIIVPAILDAFDLLIDPNTFNATMRL